MSLGYRWLIDEEAYAFLRSLSQRRRRQLERSIELLAAHPFTEPSYIDFDADDEELFHLFVGEYTIVYHVDHAIRRVLVQQICPNP